MCVTTGKAKMTGPMAYTMVHIPDHPNDTVHVTAYQIDATNVSSGPNCLLLHVPGRIIELVRGPELTEGLMHDATKMLPHLEPSRIGQGGLLRSIDDRTRLAVEEYGDYHVAWAHSPSDIEDALREVPSERRPWFDDKLAAMLNWFGERYSDHDFVLGCFDGAVKPKHPITYSYHPNNDDILVVPGLDAHDGRPPMIGERVMRNNFRVAFGLSADVQTQPVEVHYRDVRAHRAWWAPKHVSGFIDNRDDAPNADYTASLEDLQNGLHGPELIAEMVL